MSTQSLHGVVVDQCANRMCPQKGVDPSEMVNDDIMLAQVTWQVSSKRPMSQVTRCTSKINDAESTVLRSLLSGEKEGMDRKRDSTLAKATNRKSYQPTILLFLAHHSRQGDVSQRHRRTELD